MVGDMITLIVASPNTEEEEEALYSLRQSLAQLLCDFDHRPPKGAWVY